MKKLKNLGCLLIIKQNVVYLYDNGYLSFSFRELAKELLNSQQLELFKRYDEEVRDRKKLIEEKV